MKELGYLGMDTIRIFFYYNFLGVKAIFFSKPIQTNVSIF